MSKYPSSVGTNNIALIDFPVINEVKFVLGSKSSQHTATQLSLSNSGIINGSLAYLSTSVLLDNLQGSKDVSLQEAISGYRIIRPVFEESEIKINKEFRAHSLYYGRMYFPQSALEAMVIKKFTPTVQLLIKCVSSERLKNNGTMTFYLQNNGRKLTSEYIFSTNEALFGFRCLYSFKQGAERLNTALYSNSSLSLGTEIWYGALNMSPGLSTALRYSTQSTYTGKPLTMTLAFNPILGHISSTYSVKTSINSTFSSRYDFNLYSYDSNLSFGCEIFKFKDLTAPLKKIDSHLPPFTHDNSKSSVVEAFESLVHDTDFSSVIKLSTDLNSRNVKMAWEGKYKDFLVSTGLDLHLDKIPDVTKYGFSVQYSS